MHMRHSSSSVAEGHLHTALSFQHRLLRPIPVCVSRGLGTAEYAP